MMPKVDTITFDEKRPPPSVAWDCYRRTCEALGRACPLVPFDELSERAQEFWTHFVAEITEEMAEQNGQDDSPETRD